MYTTRVEAGFSAVHRVRMPNGTLEPDHGHDWVVRAFFARSELNEKGMVIDFHDAESSLKAVLAQLHHTDLNSHQAFAGALPTAEIVAKYVFDQLRASGLAAVCRIEVAEAPGCIAIYESSRPS